jgi:hypothetical protein
VYRLERNSIPFATQVTTIHSRVGTLNPAQKTSTHRELYRLLEGWQAAHPEISDRGVPRVQDVILARWLCWTFDCRTDSEGRIADAIHRFGVDRDNVPYISMISNMLSRPRTETIPLLSRLSVACIPEHSSAKMNNAVLTPTRMNVPCGKLPCGTRKV